MKETFKILKSISPRYYKKRWRKFLSQDTLGNLYIEGVSVKTLEKKYGTPIYVFVESEIRSKLKKFKEAFPYDKFQPQYACKCNSNLEVLKIVREEGFEFDASSVGEIILGLLADFEPEQITFTNLYKTEQDIYFASEIGVKAITVDSIEELNRVVKVASRQSKKIPIMLRINPMISQGKFNTKNQKYGIPIASFSKAIKIAVNCENILLKGIHYHGSYASSSRNYYLAFNKIFKIIKKLHKIGVNIELLDLGGGFPPEAPIAYRPGKYFEPEELGEKFVKYITSKFEKNSIEKPTLIFEPGKSIVASCGIGLMKVISIKKLHKKLCAVTDASTYSMFPDILVTKCWYDLLPATKMNNNRVQKYEIVGLTCDCIDIIENSEKFPELSEGDLIAAMDCGAYSYVIASNFNNLKRPPIILIKPDGTSKMIRRRDRYADMFSPELDVLKIADPYELKKYYDLTRVNLEKLWEGNEKDAKKET